MILKTKIIIFLLILAGFGGGILVSNFYTPNSNFFCDDSKFRYINKELACDGGNYTIAKHGYLDLKNKIEQLVRQKIEEGEVSNVSVYFRDLENGPTLGINEHEKFVPASLLKIPTLLTYLRLAEEDPKLLDEKVGFRVEGNDPALKQSFIPKETIQENTPYTIEELLRRMIVYSDNRAKEVLDNYLKKISPDKDLFNETMQDLGIVNPQTIFTEAITVKSYASIFTQLYNVSFLETKEMSEKALTLLTNSDFNQGLVAGVPAGVEVAHKFGERFDLPGDKKQLHDCGIVYYPGNPYLICIMTRGSDFNELTEVINQISKMFYEEVDSRRIE